MASTSSSQQQNAFSGIEPDVKRRKVEQSSRLFDVFINHRGPDVKQSLATQLYRALQQLGIRAFLDSEEKELGTSFPSTIETAILSASAHIAIFSKGYAHSPWCLAELVLMLQSTGKIIPVFYQVEPWELRHIEKGVYKDAFLEYADKGRYIEKIQEWKGALQSVSFTTGYEINGLDSSDCREIVSAVEKEVQRTKRLHVANYPVGLDNIVKDFERRCLRDRVLDFESQCGMNTSGEEKPKVVGIFGMGGVGKTTLSKELFNQNMSQCSRACFLFDVREASASGRLPALQSELLSYIFYEDHNFVSSEEGKSCLRDRFQRSRSLSFLIVLDDIGHVDQLEALIPLDLLNKYDDYLVVITTRDVGVLVMAGIDTGYHLKGLNRKDGKELFCWHAFRQPHPRSEYEDLVKTFVKVCGGLPLSLQVLGRHVFGRDLPYWRDELKKVRKTLPGDVKKRLKISIDSLDCEEQQIFMDVACFFIGKSTSMAKRIWEACGWSSHHALEKLKDKCLLEEKISPKFRLCALRVPVLKVRLKTRQDRSYLMMHDHLRDLGREMAIELSHPHRVWKPQHLQSLELNGLQNILAEIKGRCFQSFWDESMGCKITYFVRESESGSDTSLLWLQLDYRRGSRPRGNINASCIPSWIPLQNVQCIGIKNGCFQRLWQSDVQAPSHLKDLRIHKTSLKEFPDLSGKSDDIEDVVLSIHDFGTNVWFLLGSLGLNLRSLSVTGPRFTGDTAEGASFQSSYINDFKPNLEGELAFTNERWSRTTMGGDEDLHMKWCRTIMKEVVNLEIGWCKLVTKILITGVCCQRLQSLKICYMENIIEVDLARIQTLNFLDITHCEKFKRLSLAPDLTKLSHLYIKECPEFEELSGLARLTRLEEIEIDNCEKLQNIMLPMAMTRLSLRNCRYLQRVVGTGDISKLAGLIILKCPELEELPSFSRASCSEEINIEYCDKLENITLPEALIELSVQRCRSLQSVEVTNDLTKVTRLNIYDCPELEKLPSFSCLEQINIEHCDKIENITLSATLIELSLQRCRNLQRVVATGELTKLKQLKINECPDLEEFPSLARLPCLEHIKIYYCEKLENIILPAILISLYTGSCRKLQITVAGDFKKLTQLNVDECPELKEFPCLCRASCLEEIVIDSCDKLRNITLPTAVISLQVRSCINLQRIGVDGDLTKLRRFFVKECPELQELPCLARVNCLEEFDIDCCEKVENIALPTTVISFSARSCRNVQSLAVNGDLTKLTRLYINNCPKLEELPSLCKVSCLEEIVIESCEKLQSMSEIEHLRASKYLKLSYCSNAVLRNYIHKLKSVPSELDMIGRAADGAVSCLNENPFCDENLDFHEVTQIGTHKNYPKWSKSSASIRCYLVVIDGSTLAEEINESLPQNAYCYDPDIGNGRSIHIRQGEWIITMVGSDSCSYTDIENVFGRFGKLKRGFWIEVKNDEDRRKVLCAIVDHLHSL